MQSKTAPCRLKLPRVRILIETSGAYGRGLVEGIGRYLSIHGPWSVYFDIHALEKPLTVSDVQWQGDGMICYTVRPADSKRLLGSRLPLIDLSADPSSGAQGVFSNQNRIAELGVKHFLDQGLRNIAFFAPAHGRWIAPLLGEFQSIAQTHGITFDVFDAQGFSKRRNRRDQRQIGSWIETLPKPCGVFCAYDGFAISLMNVCHELGILIPEQIAVLGLNNDKVICSVTQPPLSSIDPCVNRIGYEAAAMLDRMMAGEKVPTKTVFVDPAGIVERQSTNILALSDEDIAKAVRIIREHACRGLKVCELAEAVTMSRRAFEKRFQRALGRTPKEEISRIRLERAQKLLCQTSMPIERVASACGFQSLTYFGRAFHRQAGMTPRAYRQAHQNPNVDQKDQGAW